MVRLQSSLRTRTPEETFRIALQYTSRFNISRITESTWLDRIGIPVFSAIRPAAVKGSLVVTAGKGISTSEARVGAIMEAIELAFSEPGNSALESENIPVSKILNHPDHQFDILDLCPKIGVQIPEDQILAAVPAEDLFCGSTVYLPAELLFIPSLPGMPSYFGYHTNGLASGNTREEAAIHGILEVIERDILSFDFVRDVSVRVVSDQHLPDTIRDLKNQIEHSGLDLILRTVINEFSIPFFKAYLIDNEGENPIFLNAGYGCHPNASIAAVRAITEAIQSRMSFIHGGREDLSKNAEINGLLNFSERSKLFRRSVESISDHTDEVTFAQITSPDFNASEIPEYLMQLLDHLDRSNVPSVLCAFHTHRNETLQVAKVVIPGLEFYNDDSNRMGRRLSLYAKSAADDHFRRP